MPDSNAHYYRRDWRESSRHLTTEGYKKADALIQAVLKAKPANRGQAEQELYDFSYIYLGHLLQKEFNLSKQQCLISHFEMNPSQREELAAALREKVLDIMVDLVGKIKENGLITQWVDYARNLSATLQNFRKITVKNIQGGKEVENISKGQADAKIGPTEEYQEALLMNEERKLHIDAALSTLNYRQREILKLSYGLGDGYAYDRPDIAKIFKISPERIRQIERETLGVLREQEGLQKNISDRSR